MDSKLILLIIFIILLILVIIYDLFNKPKEISNNNDVNPETVNNIKKDILSKSDLDNPSTAQSLAQSKASTTISSLNNKFQSISSTNTTGVVPDKVSLMLPKLSEQNETTNIRRMQQLNRNTRKAYNKKITEQIQILKDKITSYQTNDLKTTSDLVQLEKRIIKLESLRLPETNKPLPLTAINALNDVINDQQLGSAADTEIQTLDNNNIEVQTIKDTKYTDIPENDNLLGVNISSNNSKNTKDIKDIDPEID